MSAIPPLSGGKPTSGKSAATAAFDPNPTLRDLAHASLVQCGRVDTDRSGYFPVVFDEGGLVLPALDALSLWHLVREVRKNKYA
jgi:hypothetical protein